MSEDLKRRLFELLRSDEEFRYAVMGLLGIADLKASVNRLTRAVNRLTRATKTHEKRLTEVEETIRELVKIAKAHEERLARMEEIMKYHEERLTKIEETMNELVKIAKAHEERLTRIEEIMKHHEERLTKLEETMSELVKIVKAHEERLTKLEEEMAVVMKTLKYLTDRVDRIERTMERYIISLEEEANDIVQYYLRQRGIVVETKPTYFDTDYEFDIYGTNGQVTVIGEAKVRASPSTVRDLVSRVEEAMRVWPERFEGRVVKVLYCMRAEPGTVEEAGRLGVWLLESMRERNSPNL